MKKRTSLILLSIVVAAGLVAAPLLFAGPHGRGMRGMHGMRAEGFGGGGGLFGHLRQLKEELDLSDAQTDQLKAIFRDVHEQNAANREAMHDGFHDAALALLANPNDLAGAQAILDREAAAQKAMRQNLLNATSKALNVLTGEQRAKLAQIVEERRGARNRAE